MSQNPSASDLRASACVVEYLGDRARHDDPIEPALDPREIRSAGIAFASLRPAGELACDELPG
ncbi:MAG TPA: hypothetical protein VHN14_34215 [Kofleriaceae bacterium]|nr:hypothetical protein [Kofleriaceae bacterium]